MERDARLFHVMINFLIELGTIRFESWIRELMQDIKINEMKESISLFYFNIVCIFKEIYIFDNDIFTLMIDIRDYLFICLIIVIKSYISN